MGSKFFPFRADPFSERSQNIFDSVADSKSVPIPFMYNKKILKKCVTCLLYSTEVGITFIL